MAATKTMIPRQVGRGPICWASPGSALKTSASHGRQRFFSCTSGQLEKKHESGPEARASRFQMQINESMAQRIRREEAEQDRFNERRSRQVENQMWYWTGSLILMAGMAYWAGTKTAGEEDTTSTAPLHSVTAPNHNLEPTNLQACWTAIAQQIGRENITTNEDVCKAHAGSDWSSYNAKINEKPFMVAYPSTTQEVSIIMEACHERRVPVTAYTGGTSLEGHFTPTRGGLCIDFEKMDKLIKLNKEDLDVVVQPAMGWEELNESLAEEGLFFPPDPGPGAKIGGMVGTGCSGTNAYRYGTMREWVLSLTVVLADGTVIKTRQRPRKSSAGYDLTKVFIGSEGTLGLVTEAVLKVTVLPKSTSVAVASFKSIREAASCVAKVVGEGIPVAAVEILDDVQMRCINAAGSTSRSWKEAPTLFFKFAGTPGGVKEQVDMVKKLAKSSSSQSFDFAKNDSEAAELWSARKEALWSVMAQKKNESDHVWTTDVAVPISRLPDIIEETKDDIAKNGLLGSIVGHVGDGNFHAIILFNESQRKITEAVVHRMVVRAIEMEGTTTGEHGVGLVKRDYLEHELGETTVDAMRKMKKAFDPMCILNCDKIIRSEKPKKGEVKPW